MRRVTDAAKRGVAGVVVTFATGEGSGAHLRARAWRYGLDPDRIGVWRGSAGGQLVSLPGAADASAGFDDVGDFQGIERGGAVVAIAAITDFDLQPTAGPIDPSAEVINQRLADYFAQYLR